MDADTLWYAGVAKVSITPTAESIWMDGWASRQEPSTGVTQDIHAKAVALSNSSGSGGDDCSVLVSCDLCGLTATLLESVSRFALQNHGIARERLILHVTHNHSGPRLSQVSHRRDQQTSSSAPPYRPVSSSLA